LGSIEKQLHYNSLNDHSKKDDETRHKAEQKKHAVSQRFTRLHFYRRLRHRPAKWMPRSFVGKDKGSFHNPRVKRTFTNLVEQLLVNRAKHHSRSNT
jgi:hypothetical protein